ncbi:hypothetical protein Dimus_016469 [Dionaea muscipula]
MYSPSKFTPRKSHPAIPDDIPLLYLEPLAAARSSQREVSLSIEDMTSGNEEDAQVVSERKGAKPRRRENGIWWLGSGENRRRDVEENDQGSEEEEASEDDEGDSEKIETATTPGESTLQGARGTSEQEAEPAKAAGSESMEEFYDAEEGRTTTTDEDAIAGIAQHDVQKKEKSTKTRRVDPSSTISDSNFLHLQAELDRALKANARFQELLQQIKPNPLASPRS